MELNRYRYSKRRKSNVRNPIKIYRMRALSQADTNKLFLNRIQINHFGYKDKKAAWKNSAQHSIHLLRVYNRSHLCTHYTELLPRFHILRQSICSTYIA